MSDEVVRSLISTCRGWEKAHDALWVWVRVQALTIERDEARTQVEYAEDAMKGLVATVEELRVENASLRAGFVSGGWLLEMGDEIEALKAENAALQAAVEGRDDGHASH